MVIEKKIVDKFVPPFSILRSGRLGQPNLLVCLGLFQF